MNWFRGTSARPQQALAQQATPPPTPPDTPPSLPVLPIFASLLDPHYEELSKTDITKETSAGAKFYLTNPQRRGVLGHISFGVRSYLRSKCFYTATFKPLDIVPIYENPILTTLTFGFDGGHEVFNIYEYSKLARCPGKGSHVCFNAPTRRAVREWWDAGCKNGGRDDGKPGVREEFGGFYYAAFLIDPDGWRLEIVCQEMDGEP